MSFRRDVGVCGMGSLGELVGVEGGGAVAARVWCVWFEPVQFDSFCGLGPGAQRRGPRAFVEVWALVEVWAFACRVCACRENLMASRAGALLGLLSVGFESKKCSSMAFGELDWAWDATARSQGFG